MTERWLPVKGYEGLYEVSDLGRVRSIDRIRSDGAHLCGRLLHLCVRSRRYNHKSVTLSKDGKTKTLEAHRLVLIAFDDRSAQGLNVLHKNGDATDNRLVNLYWGTQKDNLRDAIAHGTVLIGSGRLNSKLTDQQVSKIREMHALGYTQVKIINELGLSVKQSTVSRVVNGHCYVSP